MVSQRVFGHGAIRDRVEVEPEGLFLREVAPSVSPEEMQERPEPQLRLSPDPRQLRLQVGAVT